MKNKKCDVIPIDQTKYSSTFYKHSLMQKIRGNFFSYNDGDSYPPVEGLGCTEPKIVLSKCKVFLSCKV